MMSGFTPGDCGGDLCTPFTYGTQEGNATGMFDDDIFGARQEKTSSLAEKNGQGSSGGGVGGADKAWEAEAPSNQVDTDWLLSLCEGDGFSLQMLNEMMRLDGGVGGAGVGVFDVGG